MERIASAIEYVLTTASMQLGGAFLLPGSTVSLAALACSFVVFAALALRTRRKRRLRPGAARRAMFPSRLWRSASGRTDIAFFVLGTMFSGMLIGWSIFSADQVRALLAGWLGTPAPQWLPEWASAGIATVALFIAYEFAYYLDHFLMHRVPILWRFHKVHHQAESLSLLTNFRIHPVEAIGFANILALILGGTSAVLQWVLGAGVDAWTLGGTNLLIMVSSVALSHLQHSHLWVGFGPCWGKWLIGPAHHQIHHSADPAHFNRNFGSVLTVFDRLMGTFHLPAERRERLSFGVHDGETAPHGWRAALLAPFLPAPHADEPPLPAPSLLN